MAKICHCEGIAVNDAVSQLAESSRLLQLHLIPETLRLTNLENAAPGAKFNIEFDHQTMTIVETVERVMASRQ